MGNPSVFINVADTSTSGQINVSGSYRNVNPAGIVGLLHLADGSWVSPAKLATGGSNNSYTIRFTGIIASAVYHLTVIVVGPAGSQPTVMVSDTIAGIVGT
jgi:hypothetical protein